MFKSSDIAYLNPSNFNSISRIFGMGQGLRFNCLFKSRKSFKNLTWLVFAFSWTTEGDPRLDPLTCLITDKLTIN